MSSVLLENQSTVRRNQPGDETRDDRKTLKRSFFVSLGVHASLLLALIIAAAIPHKIHFEQVAFIELGGVKSAGGSAGAGAAAAPAKIPAAAVKTPSPSAPGEIKTASLKPKARAIKQTPAPSEKAEKISVKSNNKSAKDVTKKTKAEPKSDLKDRILKKFSAMNAAGAPSAGASANAASSASPAGRAGENPGLQGIGTDVPFPFASYLSEVRDLITDLWEEPSWLSSGTGGAKAVVVFRITRDGTLAKVLLAVPSGMTALDKSAVQAVEAANPLPPLPAEFKNEYLDVNLEFALTR